MTITEKTRPRLLDLCCKAGGASEGYRRAGFDVTGVDIEPQRRYKSGVFVQADAIEYAKEHAHEFDAVVGSPPCKMHTSLRRFSASHHVDLIDDMREVFIASGLPYVIENVPGAPLLDPITLCGSMFGLDVRKHRIFESNLPIIAPACDHEGQAARSPGYVTARYHSGKRVDHISPVVHVYGGGSGLGAGEADEWRRAMGIDWMTRGELSQAIPPAYTEHIGRQLLAAL